MCGMDKIDILTSQREVNNSQKRLLACSLFKNILQPILKSDPLQAFIGQQINMLQQLRQKPMQ